MSNSHTSSNLAFGGLAVLVIVGSGVGLAASLKPLDHARVAATKAVASDGGVPASRLAILLDPRYAPARLTLARSALARHDEAEALSQLDHTANSLVSLNLRAQALLEAGDIPTGVRAAELAYRFKPTDTMTIRLLGASYLLSGQTSTLEVLRNQTTNAEARQTLQALGGSILSQSQALYALGLLKRSQGLLKADPNPSATAALLQGKLALNLEPKPRNYDVALTSLQSAVTQDPSNLEAHRLIVRVAHLKGDDELASKHQALVDALVANHP